MPYCFFPPSHCQPSICTLNHWQIWENPSNFALDKDHLRLNLNLASSVGSNWYHLFRTLPKSLAWPHAFPVLPPLVPYLSPMGGLLQSNTCTLILTFWFACIEPDLRLTVSPPICNILMTILNSVVLSSYYE